MVASEKIVLPLSKCLNIDYKDLQIKYLSERIYRELKHTEFSAEALEITLKRLEKEQTGTLHETTREKLLSKITAYLVTSPIDKAWLFGSFARSEESYDSDIDLLIRFIKPNKVDLFDYIGIRQDLEDLTGRQIDLVEEGQLIEKLKPIIHNEKQLIYAR